MASTSPLKKYTTYLAITGLVLAILSSFGQYFLPKFVHPLWFITLLFVIGVQWLVFAFVLKFGQHKTKTLFKQYQIAKFAKLFIYMITLIVYVFAVKTTAFAFLITFLAYYLVYTAIETWFFQRWLNTLPQTKDS